MIEFQILLLILLLFLSAFFSGVETALMSINMVKVQALLKQKRKGSEALNRIKKNPRKLIITILIGNNVVNVGAAAIATVMFMDLFGSAGVGIATGVMTFFILVFGEITPKTFATQNAERISLKVARPLEILSIILIPFVAFFEIIAKGTGKLLGSKQEEQLSEEELRTIVTMGRAEGILGKEAAEIMHNVLEFENTKVTQIMTPRVDMKVIDGSAKLKEVVDFVVKETYSRFPVYLNNPDKIVGILDVDDVLKSIRDKKPDIKIKDIARDAYFVPESKEIDDLLSEFEDKKMKIAIVVDEYGDVAGIVTLEDVLEEIVGDIFDKSKKKHVYIKKINNKEFSIDVKAPVEEMNEVFNLGLKENGATTIGGYIVNKLQRIPFKDEKIKFKHATLVVDEVTKQRIQRVRILTSN